MALKFKRSLRQYTKQKFPEAANEGALQKRCSQKFCKNHMKAPVPESLF